MLTVHTDTPLASHPSLALAVFGFAAALTPVVAAAARVAWALTHDRCQQSH